MELTPSQKESICQQFDSFCKKILREESRGYIRTLAKRASRETSLSELTEEQLSLLCEIDEYPAEQFLFAVQGYDIMVSDERLAAALTALSNSKRDIVLLSYFMDMSDQEIAEHLNPVRSTVQYRRTTSLKELKERMEGEENGA